MELGATLPRGEGSTTCKAALLSTTFPNVDPLTGRINSQPDLPTVYEVIRILFHEQGKKDLASSWLNALQGSLYSWKVADELLHGARDVESCYFAAQTLRTKIENSFSELPADSISSLRDSIMRHLLVLGENHAIQTQLCLAIVHIAILWADWQSPIEDLVNQLTSQQDTQIVTNDLPSQLSPAMKALNRKWILIELLTLMPEEIERSSLKVGANRRDQFRSYLSRFSLNVINLLNQSRAYVKQSLTELKIQQAQVISNEAALMPHAFERISVRIYRCFAAWIPIIFDYNDSQSTLACMLNDIFLDLADKDCSDNVHDAASDAICAVALVCEDYDRHSALANFVLQKLYSLEPCYWDSVSSEQTDRSINFTRMFTEMAESIVEPLIISSEKEIKFLELMLSCVGHYDYEVAEITFHFWYRFAELVYNSRRRTGKEKFGSHIIRLLISVTRHSQLEQDLEGLISAESEIAEFRARVSDMVKEIIVIVGPVDYINANGLINQIRSNIATKPTNWELTEADLFLISCITSELTSYSAAESFAESTTAPNVEINNQIINTILEIDQHSTLPGGQPLHPQLVATCCYIIGGLSPIFRYPSIVDPSTPQQLDRVLNFLLANVMKCGELSCVAAQALQAIVSECGTGDQLTPTGKAALVNVLVQICTQLDHINNESTAQNLLQCCSTIISSSFNLENGTQEEFKIHDNLILQLLTPNVIRLRELFDGQHALAQSSTDKDKITTKFDPLIYLDRISAIFRSLNLFKSSSSNDQRLVASTESGILLQTLPQTTSFIDSQLWPVLQVLLIQYAPLDARIIERTCRTVRYVVRCLHPVWLLDKIATQIVTLYQQFPAHSSFLYIGSILIDEFASPQNASTILDGLVQMLHAFCSRTFGMLSEEVSAMGEVDTLRLLRQHPDTVDDFFRLCVRFYQKLPQLFLSQSPLEGILGLTLACLALDHREANNSVVKFITELLEVSHTSSDIVHQLLTNDKLNFGVRLVDAAMTCYLFHLPSYFIPEMADIIWPLIKLHLNDFTVWLDQSLIKIPKQAGSGVHYATNEQLTEFRSDLLKAHHPKQVAAALRFLHRLYH